jgi:hypothetical protein
MDPTTESGARPAGMCDLAMWATILLPFQDQYVCFVHIIIIIIIVTMLNWEF